MPAARVVNAIACRTYAMVLGALAISFVFSTISLFGLAHGLAIIKQVAASNLLAAVICVVLAAFTWKRSIVAVSIAFALFVVSVSPEFWTHSDGDAADPIIAAAVILIFGGLLGAAIATRQNGRLPDGAAAG